MWSKRKETVLVDALSLSGVQKFTYRGVVGEITADDDERKTKHIKNLKTGTLHNTLMSFLREIDHSTGHQVADYKELFLNDSISFFDIKKNFAALHQNIYDFKIVDLIHYIETVVSAALDSQNMGLSVHEAIETPSKTKVEREAEQGEDISSA